MIPRALYLVPGLVLGFVIGAYVDRLRVGADRDAWIDRTSRCVGTLEHANDAKRRCIATLEEVSAKLAQVEASDVIEARLRHAEPSRGSLGSASAGKRPLEAGSSPELMTITSTEQDHGHEGT